jgi:uncharacterized protein
MTAGQHIDYDALALEALRGVVKACLAQVAETGLLGDHHFYIAFNTQAAGVGLSKRLKEKYPVEMTIVLQHRFWDLAVDDDRFEVKLTFDGIPERLVVPFKAIKVFYDPSVPYGLQFEEAEAAGAAGASRRPPFAVGHARDGDPRAGRAGEREDGLGDLAERGDRRRPHRRPRSDRSSEPRPATQVQLASAGDTPDESRGSAGEEAAPTPPAVAKPPTVVTVTASDAPEDKPADAAPDNADTTGGAKVFDLSKFRNKK